MKKKILAVDSEVEQKVQLVATDNVLQSRHLNSDILTTNLQKIHFIGIGLRTAVVQ
jgi:hypothetical protein